MLVPTSRKNMNRKHAIIRSISRRAAFFLLMIIFVPALIYMFQGV